MKRRGIRPTPHSYSTFFSALLKLDTEFPPNVMTRIRAVYGQWQQYIADRTSGNSVTKHVPQQQYGLPSSNIPSNAYFALLARLQDLTGLKEAFDLLPQSGPFAADIVTYTIMLQAYGRDSQSTSMQAARDIWAALLRNSRIETLDSQAVVAAMNALGGNSTQRSAQLSALCVARAAFGFIVPVPGKESDLPSDVPQAALDGPAFEAILALLLKADQRTLATSWLKQIEDQRMLPADTDTKHVENVMRMFVGTANVSSAQGVFRSTVMVVLADPAS